MCFSKPQNLHLKENSRKFVQETISCIQYKNSIRK